MQASEELKTQTALAKKSRVAQSTIGRILRQEVSPQSANLEHIAKAFGMSLIELAALGQDDEVGRRSVESPDTVGSARGVPLISWVQAGEFVESEDTYQPGDAEDWLKYPKRRCGPRTFALRVSGESMNPVYQNGDIIYVDPDVVPEHGKDVVVRLDDRNEVIFKRLVIEGERRYLKPVNPDWQPKFIDVPADARIVGVVIGKWVDI